MTPGRLREVLKSVKRLIRHGVGLQVTPHVLRRIQLWSIGGQEDRVPALSPGDIVLNEARPVGHEPIP